MLSSPLLFIHTDFLLIVYQEDIPDMIATFLQHWTKNNKEAEERPSKRQRTSPPAPVASSSSAPFRFPTPPAVALAEGRTLKVPAKLRSASPSMPSDPILYRPFRQVVIAESELNVSLEGLDVE